jgi:hypothetical protein
MDSICGSLRLKSSCAGIGGATMLVAAVALELFVPVKKMLPAKSDRARTIAQTFNTFDHLFFILCPSGL